MHHIIFEESQQFKTALLIKSSAFNQAEIEFNYVNPLVDVGIPKTDLIAFTLDYNSSGKAPAKLVATYLEKLMPALDGLGVTTLYCADATYFKKLSGMRKAEPSLGDCLPCKIKGYEHMQVILGINHKSLIYDTKNEDKLALSMEALKQTMLGNFKAPGTDIIHFEKYPSKPENIRQWLDKLHDYDELAVDIETFSLRFFEAGIGSIGFAWSKHEGISFCVDYKEFLPNADPLKKLVALDHVPTANGCKSLQEYLNKCVTEASKFYGTYRPNTEIRAALKEFFETYKGKLVFHNAPFDTKVMIYVLFMQNMLDNEGLLTGLEYFYRDIDDTKIIRYLATNSTAGNDLSLKGSAQEFAGNWAQDDDAIKDIRKIPKKDLLKYNLVDCLATLYTKEKHYPQMVADQQEGLYKEYMLDYQKDITQVELSGMPMDVEGIQQAKKELLTIAKRYLGLIQDHPATKQAEDILTHNKWTKDYEDRKGKAKNPDKILPKDRKTFPQVTLNPNSPKQLVVLLYEVLGLPVIEKTKTKQPATGADVIDKLVNHAKDLTQKELMNALNEYSKAQKILSTFIPPFEEGVVKEDGHKYLHGSLNLGGTVSGRLSSSDPNLQNIPSGSTYGKLIKKCFKAPPGWLFVGADFNSLEDYISALTTNDPNKLKVYLGEKIYEIVIDGVQHHIRGDSTVIYDGKTFTGDEFYEAYS